jgi:hypothetical protein
MLREETADIGRHLRIPREIPEDFADAVATLLILGMARREVWDTIYQVRPEKALAWIRAILEANELSGLLHPDMLWWENQVRGH